MPRDYKSRAQSHSRRSQKKSLPGYIWLLSGLGIGLFVAFIIYLDKQPENETNFGDAVQFELEKLKQQAKQQPAESDSADTNSSGTGNTNTEDSTQKKKEQKFNFYTLLPELEVLIPKSETQPPKIKAAKKPDPKPDSRNTSSNNSSSKNKSAPDIYKPTKAGKQYILQVGSFQSLNDAEKLKANLAFLGVTANIQRVNIKRQTWHRVRTGPYKNKQQLYTSQSKLKRNGINGISMELK